MAPEEIEKFKATITKMQERKEATGKEMMVPICKVLTDEQSIKFYNDKISEFPALNVKIPFLTVAHTMKHKPENYLPEVDVPILIVGASNDGVNPITESQHLFQKANEPKKLVVIDGASHFDVYSGKYFDEVITEELQWFQKYLL
jgi:alpha-beta hydrolase superfamily lysophospholipase